VYPSRSTTATNARTANMRLIRCFCGTTTVPAALVGVLALLTLLPRSAAAFTTQLDRMRWNVKVAVDLPGRASSNSETPLVHSRQPHKLKNGRGTFLGFRNAKDVPGLKLQSSMDPLMPDGGLSPCVIRVLGVGGGGCNAVRDSFLLVWWLVVCRAWCCGWDLFTCRRLFPFYVSFTLSHKRTHTLSLSHTHTGRPHVGTGGGWRRVLGH
jgi:hypothetical protein